MNDDANPIQPFAGPSRRARPLPVLTYDEVFMREALRQADLGASLGEVPVGAVVVHEGQILAVAHNRRELDQDPSAHAELLAMRAAAKALGTWRLEGCTVYVTLEPCPMCAGAMVLARIGGCVYGCTDPKGGYLGTIGDISDVPELNHRFPVVSGVLADPCSARLKEFFRARRGRERPHLWRGGRAV